jgi:hypothetical protein
MKENEQGEHPYKQYRIITGEYGGLGGRLSSGECNCPLDEAKIIYVGEVHEPWSSNAIESFLESYCRPGDIVLQERAACGVEIKTTSLGVKYFGWDDMDLCNEVWRLRKEGIAIRKKIDHIKDLQRQEIEEKFPSPSMFQKRRNPKTYVPDQETPLNKYELLARKEAFAKELELRDSELITQLLLQKYNAWVTEIDITFRQRDQLLVLAIKQAREKFPNSRIFVHAGHSHLHSALFSQFGEEKYFSLYCLSDDRNVPSM